MDKSPDAFRTISEVAEDLDLPQHVLRFWETRFTHIKPLKRGGGRRYYRPDDIDLLKGIRHLLYGEGYTIKGVQRILKEEGIRFVQAVGRGEQSVGALGPEAQAAAGEAFGEDEDFTGNHCLQTGATTAAPSQDVLSRKAVQSLQAALEELMECERVLSSLRNPSGPAAGD